MDNKSPNRSPHKTIILVSALVFCVAAGAYIFTYHDPAQTLEIYLKDQIHPLVFLFLMAVLPIIGAPVSIFLVMVSIKFGIVFGIAVTALCMAFHMAVSYYLAHSFVYKWLTGLLRLFNITLPNFVGHLSMRTAFVFMLIPGVPYVVKNNVLALSKIDFLPYMLINWTAQFGMSIPLIILGRAVVEMNFYILAAAAALLVLIYLIQYLVKRRYTPPSEEWKLPEKNE